MTRASLGLWCAVYTVLTIVITFPLVAHLSSAVPHDLGDPLLSTSILWWNAHVVPLTARWWNGFAFWPSSGMMAFSDHRLGLSLIASPLQWLGCSSVTAYNLTLLATFPLCALAAHGLALTLTGRHDAAVLCGLAYGFNPYRVAHLEHLELLAAFPMPAALAALHLYAKTRRTRWIVAFGLAWVLQGLCASYYFVFFGVVLALWVLWFTRWRDRKILVPIAAACVCSIAALLPIAVGYWRVHRYYGLLRGFDEVILFSADITSIVTASPLVRLWGWTAPLNGIERQLFPGFTIGALVLAGAFATTRQQQVGRDSSYRVAAWLAALGGLFAAIAVSAIVLGPWRVAAGWLSFSVGAAFKPFSIAVAILILAIAALPQTRTAFHRRSPFAFYLLLTAILFVLSLGPKPTFLGIPVLYRGPYSLLMELPAFSDGIRVPARFAMPAILALSVSGALAFSHLGGGNWTHRAVLLVLAAGIVADGWTWKLPLPAPPDMWPIARAQDFAAVLEVPLGDLREFGAMYRATHHGRPTVDGDSGYVPAHHHVLRTALAEGDQTALDAIAASGPLLVVVDKRIDPDGRWDAVVRRAARVAALQSGERWAFFSLPQAPAATGCTGSELPVSAASDNRGPVALNHITDGNPLTWWSSPEPQTKGERFLLDLGRPVRPCAVALFVGPYVQGYPRSLGVDTSLDGTSWESAFAGRGAGLAIRGALELPRAVPIRIPLASRPARFIRLTLLESETKFRWMITDVIVSGDAF